MSEETDSNRYYRFYPAEGKVANSGNEYRLGYFKSSLETSDDNMVIDLIDEFPIDKLKLEISLKLDSLMNSPLCLRYYGMLNGNQNYVYHFLKFTADGAITNASDSRVSTYTAGEWMDFVIYIDYQEYFVIVNMDGERLFSAVFDVSVTNFNQIRFTSADESRIDSGITVPVGAWVSEGFYP